MELAIIALIAGVFNLMALGMTFYLVLKRK